MRTNIEMRDKKAKHVFEMLVNNAVMERIAYSKREREYHQRNKGVGHTIRKLSEEDRQLLSTLQSDDVKDYRHDLLDIMCVCDNGRYV